MDSFGEDVWSQAMRTIPLFTCFLCVWFTPIEAAGAADSDKLAREAYLRFCQAFNKKDLDGLMKVVDIPWLASGKPVVKDRDKLQKIWKDLLARKNIGVPLPLPNWKVEPVAFLRKAAKEDKEFLTRLKELGLTKEDRVVNEGITIFIVRLRKGEAKIVGYFDVGLNFHGKLFP
jgi:hypothetical protein